MAVNEPFAHDSRCRAVEKSLHTSNEFIFFKQPKQPKALKFFLSIAPTEVYNSMGDAGEQEMQVALRVFAHYLGINADTEQELLAVAEEVFYDLPKDWEVGIGEDEHAGIP